MMCSTLFPPQYPPWLRPMLNQPSRPDRNRVVRRVPPIPRPTSVRELAPACNRRRRRQERRIIRRRLEARVPACFCTMAVVFDLTTRTTRRTSGLNEIFLAHAVFLYNDDC